MTGECDKLGDSDKQIKNLTQEQILAWADGLIGISSQETADKLGKHQNTIINWRNTVAEFIGQKFDINDYRLPLYGLYTLGLKSLMTLLAKNDGPVTIAYFKGIGLFREKSEIETSYTNLSDDDLDDIKQSIIDRAARRFKDADED